MADTVPYVRGTSFTDAQVANPSAPSSGPALDGEYDRIRLSLDSIGQSLDLIQRDDGRLANGIVGLDALDPAVYTGLRPATAWAAGVSFARYDTVMVSVAGKNQLYRAEANHVSTVFLADRDAGKWSLLVDFTLPTSAGPWLLIADLTLQHAVALLLGTTGRLSETADGVKLISTNPLSLKVETDIGVNIRNLAGTKIAAFFHPGGAQTLFYDGTERFRTVFDGAKVTGALAADSVAGAMRVLTGSALNAAPTEVGKVATPAAVAEYVALKSLSTLGVPGQVTSPSGEIVKRGTFSLGAADGSTQDLVFSTPFPTACDFVRVHTETTAVVHPWPTLRTVNGFRLQKGTGTTAVTGVWEAVGH